MYNINNPNFTGHTDFATDEDQTKIYGGKIYYKDLFIKLVPYVFKTKSAAEKRVEELVNISNVVIESDTEVWIKFDDGRTYKYLKI